MSKKNTIERLRPRPAFIRYFLGYLATFMVSMFTKTKVRGRENIPKEGPFIIIINHFSYVDPIFVIHAVQKPISFLAASDQKIKWWISQPMTLQAVPTAAGKLAYQYVPWLKTGKNEKLSAFLTLANYFMEIMQQNEDLDVALVLDEAPQYCPYKPSGIQSKTTDIIIDICALGRTHKLCMCLLSQGIAGEIGINAAVRRNLNIEKKSPGEKFKHVYKISP